MPQADWTKYLEAITGLRSTISNRLNKKKRFESKHQRTLRMENLNRLNEFKALEPQDMTSVMACQAQLFNLALQIDDIAKTKEAQSFITEFANMSDPKKLFEQAIVFGKNAEPSYADIGDRLLTRIYAYSRPNVKLAQEIARFEIARGRDRGNLRQLLDRIKQGIPSNAKPFKTPTKGDYLAVLEKYAASLSPVNPLFIGQNMPPSDKRTVIAIGPDQLVSPNFVFSGQPPYDQVSINSKDMTPNPLYAGGNSELSNFVPSAQSPYAQDSNNNLSPNMTPNPLYAGGDSEVPKYLPMASPRASFSLKPSSKSPNAQLSSHLLGGEHRPANGGSTAQEGGRFAPLYENIDEIPLLRLYDLPKKPLRAFREFADRDNSSPQAEQYQNVVTKQSAAIISSTSPAVIVASSTQTTSSPNILPEGLIEHIQKHPITQARTTFEPGYGTEQVVLTIDDSRKKLEPNLGKPAWIEWSDEKQVFVVNKTAIKNYSGPLFMPRLNENNDQVNDAKGQPMNDMLYYEKGNLVPEKSFIAPAGTPPSEGRSTVEAEYQQKILQIHEQKVFKQSKVIDTDAQKKLAKMPIIADSSQPPRIQRSRSLSLPSRSARLLG